MRVLRVLILDLLSTTTLRPKTGSIKTETKMLKTALQIALLLGASGHVDVFLIDSQLNNYFCFFFLIFILGTKFLSTDKIF